MPLLIIRSFIGKNEKPQIQLDPLCWTDQEKVNSEDNELFTKDEIKKVVFSMKKNYNSRARSYSSGILSTVLGDNKIGPGRPV